VTTTPDFTISAAAPEDWDTVFTMLSEAFAEDPDEAMRAEEKAIFEAGRTLLARRGDELIGNAGVFTRRLTVPGNTVPAAHVTMVGVAPTARRQGVLTAMMRRQLADVHSAAEPVAILWASEGRIYQRFGYGLAARRVALSVDTREVKITATASVEGRLRTAAAADVRDELVKVYEREWATRTGWSERAEQHWGYRLADPESRREGASTLRAVLHEGPGGVDGYAIYRIKADWNDRGPAGEVRLEEVVATTAEAYLAVWRFLLTIDLTRKVSTWRGAAVDEPLLHLVNEPRQLEAKIGDSLWLRVVDVPAALAARQYPADVDLVLEVTDDLLTHNAGRWRLRASALGTATCEPTTDEPDLACDVKALGAAYLGDQVLGGLADAGQVRELRPGALARACAAFGWHRAPSAIEIF
jgi:predicted acetyltransferase